jgi:hypothetical protein
MSSVNALQSSNGNHKINFDTRSNKGNGYGMRSNDDQLAIYRNKRLKLKDVVLNDPLFNNPDGGTSSAIHENLNSRGPYNHRGKTQNFTEKAIKKHGDRYDYSSVDYIHCMSKVVIICKLHGKFSQRANDHLQGSGCKECAILSNAIKLRGLHLEFDTSRSNTVEFIEKAILVHGSRYAYSDVNYINSVSKVVICV